MNMIKGKVCAAIFSLLLGFSGCKFTLPPSEDPKGIDEKSEIRSLICAEERRIVQLCAENNKVLELNEGSCYIYYRKEQHPDDMRYSLYEEYYVNFAQKTFVERYPSLGCAKFGVIGNADISPEDSNIVKVLWTENSVKIIVRDVDRPYVYRVRTEIEDRGDYFLFNGLVFKKERQ